MGEERREGSKASPNRSRDRVEEVLSLIFQPVPAHWDEEGDAPHDHRKHDPFIFFFFTFFFFHALHFHFSLMFKWNLLAELWASFLNFFASFWLEGESSWEGSSSFWLEGSIFLLFYFSFSFSFRSALLVHSGKEKKRDFCFLHKLLSKGPSRRDEAKKTRCSVSSVG